MDKGTNKLISILKRKGKEFAIIAGIEAILILVAFAPVLAGVIYPAGSLLQPNDVTSSHIRDGVIVDADVSSTAAIAYSKLNLTGLIVDADVSSTAAIAVSKIATSSSRDFITNSAQTWDGLKTFSTFPQIPTGTPANDADAVSKAYLLTQTGTIMTPSMTAYATINANTFVAVGNGTTGFWYANTNQTPDSTIPVGQTGFTQVEQTFRTIHPIVVKEVRVSVAKSGSPTDNFIVSIRNSQGGAYIASSTRSGINITTTQTYYTFTLDNEVSMTATSSYRVALTRSGAADNTNFYVAQIDATGTYADGQTSYHNGSIWVNEAYDIDINVGVVPTGGQIAMASAASSTSVIPILGIVTATTSAASTAQVALVGTVTGYSNLVTGSQYYLSNWGGVASTTAGTISKKVGIGTATTSLLIRIEP